MKLFIPFLLFMTSASIAAPSAIAEFFSELKTFTADFSQTVKQDGAVIQTSKGSVKLKKPLQFRWDYQTPEPMALVSDGKDFYHYDIDLAQVTVKPVNEVTDSALITLLKDNQTLDDGFTIKSFGAPAVKQRFPKQADTWLKKADIFYSLTPKQRQQSDNSASMIVIGLTAQRQLSVFYAKDAYGENIFLFDAIQQNTPLANEEFVFTAPKGVDVLGQE